MSCVTPAALTACRKRATGAPNAKNMMASGPASLTCLTTDEKSVVLESKFLLKITVPPNCCAEIPSVLTYSWTCALESATTAHFFSPFLLAYLAMASVDCWFEGMLLNPQGTCLGSFSKAGGLFVYMMK